MSAVETIAAIVGITTGGAALVGMAWRGERRARRLATRLLGDDTTPGALDRLDDVWHQVHPNSGTSLRDGVDRIERQLTEHVRASWDQVHR